jgi:hypothetical protein
VTTKMSSGGSAAVTRTRRAWTTTVRRPDGSTWKHHTTLVVQPKHTSRVTITAATSSAAMGSSHVQPQPPPPQQPDDAGASAVGAPAAKVTLGGVSMLRGGVDGWTDDKPHAVYSFTVHWLRSSPPGGESGDEDADFEFTERYSSARAKHQQLIAAHSEAELEAAAAASLATEAGEALAPSCFAGLTFPRPSLNPFSRTNADPATVLRRGQQLAAYYQELITRAAASAVARQRLHHLFALEWPAVTGSQEERAGADRKNPGRQRTKLPRCTWTVGAVTSST